MYGGPPGMYMHPNMIPPGKLANVVEAKLAKYCNAKKGSYSHSFQVLYELQWCCAIEYVI